VRRHKSRDCGSRKSEVRSTKSKHVIQVARMQGCSSCIGHRVTQSELVTHHWASDCTCTPSEVRSRVSEATRRLGRRRRTGHVRWFKYFPSAPSLAPSPFFPPSAMRTTVGAGAARSYHSFEDGCLSSFGGRLTHRPNRPPIRL
jgi:hypothetical protein